MTEPAPPLRIQGYQISAALFTSGYAAGDGPCRCGSQCCARGAYVDLGERDKILKHAELIKPHLDATQSHDESDWFEPEIKLDADYASGSCVGTAVIADKCALLDGQGRCSLQVAMTALGQDRWQLKPFYCVLFPLEVLDGEIRFNSALQGQRACCSVHAEFQQPLFEACRDELVYLVGEAGFASLQAHYALHYAPQPAASAARSLPLMPTK